MKLRSNRTLSQPPISVNVAAGVTNSNTNQNLVPEAEPKVESNVETLHCDESFPVDNSKNEDDLHIDSPLVDVAAGVTNSNTNQNLVPESEPKAESNVETLHCDESFPVDNSKNEDDLHIDSPLGYIDPSAEMFDLNEVPDVDDNMVYAESSRSRKRKSQKLYNMRGSSKKYKEAIGDSDFEEEIQYFEEEIQDSEDFSEPEIVNVPVVAPRVVKKAKKRGNGKKDRPPLLWEIWEEEDKKWLDGVMDQGADLNQQNEVEVETMEASNDLILPLLRYQKEWLSWGLKQEESVIKGGILADEMGMGKTLQAIALVLAKREMIRAIGDANMPPFPNTSDELFEVKCTIVICPVVAVNQWKSEIEKFTSEGCCKVLVHHGVNRGRSMEQFSKYDFVLTTYAIVESEYRRFMMPPKQKCRWCRRAYGEKAMQTHERYYCGPNANRTELQSKQDKKKLNRFSSKDVNKTATDSSKYNALEKGDIEKGASKKSGRKCRTSQNGQVGNEEETTFPVGTKESKEKSILHSVKWDRIILDEAHYIKDKRSNTAKAILALESNYKWALSGTPLQNRVGELYSLIRFLRIVPYSFYLCKDCDCRTLDYSPASDCTGCPHKCVRHFCWWNRNVATPIQESGNGNRGKRAMVLLRQKILKTILLRRTKIDRACDLALPPRIVSLRRDTLDVKEEDYYTSLYDESQAQFNTYVQQGTVMNNYAHIFDLLTRLRQAVDHPYLIVYSATAATAKANEAAEAKYNDEQACTMCHKKVEDTVVTSCSHTFCKACLIKNSLNLGEVSCPSCSKPITVDFSSTPSSGDTKERIKGFKRKSILNRIKLEDFQTSTKIDALREEIRNMVERDGSAKGIVFSQFTSFLDLISYSLQKSGIVCVQLVGSMTMSARDAAIKRFTEDPECTIFLMSLKAGGVALNLTAASHVFLMDPWWNPAVERQAQDRIHRIGQYKPIRIVRFVIANTIEERILKLQAKKELVFEGTVGGSTEALGKLTEADMRYLFIT